MPRVWFEKKQASIARALDERDHQILLSLLQHKVFTTDQVKLQARRNPQRPAVPRLEYRSELLERLLADACELAALRQKSRCTTFGDWPIFTAREGRKASMVKKMTARRRKTLVVCSTCHDRIHAGRSQGQG